MWSRLLASWALAAGLLLLARPHAPAAPWSRWDGAVVGIAVGSALALALIGRRPAVSFGAATMLVLTAGAEEVVWRWFALGSLAGLIGAGPALVATSLAFGAAHPGARRQHTVTGFAFGTVYLAAGSLIAAWCAHCSYNLIVATAARRAPPESA